MWSERYRPDKLEDLIGNEEPRTKLLSWLRRWKPGSKAALLVGPPGTGKTTTVHLVAAKLGMSLVELNASDTRAKDKLSRRIGEVIFATNLFGEKTLVFLDEVDGLAGRADYGAIDYIRDAVRKSQNPVVMAANNRDADEVRKLASVTYKLEFGRPSPDDAAGLLNRVAKKEGVAIAPEVIARIVKSANGDLRVALNSLQMGSPGVKDEDLTAAEAVNAFFEAIDGRSALDALRAYPGQPRDKLRDMFVAVLKARILEERKAAALEVLSRADMLVGRIYRGQDWRLLRYLDQMLAYELREAVGDGGASYSQDAVPWPLQLRIWNDSRKLRDIASGLGKRLQISQRGALVEDIPFFLLMCNSDGFRSEAVKSMGLEENYAVFLEKEASRSAKQATR